MTTDLESRLRQHLTAARRAADRPLASALRTCLAALDNASAVPHEQGVGGLDEGPIAGAAAGLGAGEAPRRELNAAEQRSVVQLELDDLRAQADSYAAAGRTGESDQQRRAVAAVDALLDEPVPR